MTGSDTVRLLRECDAGVKMGLDGIESVLDRVRSGAFRRRLEKCGREHEKLDREIQALLKKYRDEGKDLGPVVKGMSRIKTGIKLAADSSDGAIADLMTDGCSMGVKSLSKFLNQYAAAEDARDITRRLIDSEERLSADIRIYL